MSIGPMTSVFGSPLAQSSGSDVEKARQEAGAQQHASSAAAKADNAAGIAETDGQEHETADRDADGRRIWEINHERRKTDQPETAEPPPAGKDATDDSGNQLDLTG